MTTQVDATAEKAASPEHSEPVSALPDSTGQPWDTPGDDDVGLRPLEAAALRLRAAGAA